MIHLLCCHLNFNKLEEKDGEIKLFYCRISQNAPYFFTFHMICIVLPNEKKNGTFLD